MRKWWIGIAGVVLIGVIAVLAFNMGSNSLKSADDNQNETEQTANKDEEKKTDKKEGGISTHVLDQSKGEPAAGVPVTLYRINKSGDRTELKKTKTAEDGRVKELLAPNQVKEGEYEIVFSVGKYFKENGANTEFLTDIPVRFKVEDENAHYHVPIVAAPGGYSTYHGS